jgi:tetratricopeptide (TPR) repeat protein
MAISYLEIFINQAQADPDQKENESRACNQLGELYNKIGKYELAVPYFERHFAILNETSNETVKNDKESDTWRNYRAKTKDIRSAKVQLGIAKANDNLNFYFETVSDPKGVGALLQWKSQQTFGDYIPPTQRVMVSQ